MSKSICNTCGASLVDRDGRWVCPACGTYAPEEITNEELTLLYNANMLLRTLDFDGAESAFTDLIERYPKNSAGYWGRLRARFGIKYERDYNGKNLPTCYAEVNSVLSDRDYLKAIQYADSATKDVYQKQAAEIEKIRKIWLEKASKEKPYDIFICFKDSDTENGEQHTADSSQAKELYFHLRGLGYRVFFSPVSLNGISGEEYEPYIYNALSTATVMLVYGSRAEYFSSTWMKNEWTRFLKRIREKQKAEGSLLVICDGMNPSELPQGLRSLQALDAKSLSFAQTLEARVAEIIDQNKKPKSVLERIQIKTEVGKKKTVVGKTIPTVKAGGALGKKESAGMAQTIKTRELGEFAIPSLPLEEQRKIDIVETFMKQGLYEDASMYVDEILSANEGNGKAYLLKFLIEAKVNSIEEIRTAPTFPSDFRLLHHVIEFNEKSIGERFVNALLNALFACSQEQVSAQTIEQCARLFDELIKYSPENNEDNVERLLRFAENCKRNRSFELAIHYYGLALNLDDHLHNAYWGILQCKLKCRNDEELIAQKAPITHFAEFNSALEATGDDKAAAERYISLKKRQMDLPAEYKAKKAKDRENKIADFKDWLYDHRIVCAVCIGILVIAAVISGIVIKRENSLNFASDKNGGYVLSYVGKNYPGPDLVIPSTYKGKPVTGISSGAFSKNKNMIAVTIPDSVTSIGDFAFDGCTWLTSIAIPDSVTSIDYKTFYGCTGLTSITIPDSVTSIGDSAFYGCTGLTSITIPDSVTSIGRAAFYGCTGLTSITIPFVGATKDGTEDTRFGYIFRVDSFSGYAEMVPSSLKNVVITGGTRINDYAFKDCAGLTSITIPDSVTSIGGYAFSGCTGLTSITIPNSVTSIGSFSFRDCMGLTSITIPDSVTSIEGRAFDGWTSSQTIYCQAKSQPDTWYSEWYCDWKYGCDAKIVWGA